MQEANKRIKELEEKITTLSDALAHLGQGMSLKELLKIIRFPGYTTPAELAFSIAMLDSMQIHGNTLNKIRMEIDCGG